MSNLANHNGFKLIAIIPLEGCDSIFRKNLEIGTPYLFYDNYKIKFEDNKFTIKEIEVIQSEIPQSLYNLENTIKVNISAVVGTNGSGKSALIELFYYFIYAVSSMEIAEELKLSKYSSCIASELQELESDKKKLEGTSNVADRQNLSIKLQKKYNIQIDLKNVRADYHRLLIEAIDDKIDQTEKRLENTNDIEDRIEKSLNLSVIYEIDSGLFIFELIKGQLTIKDKKGNDISKGFSFTNFFYTISLNYSHHSLNSNTLGEWINSLFHKNDGYKTPVVINPMRENGMYDINRELYLSQERLMFNLAYYLIKSQDSDKEYKLLDKYKIEKIVFSLKLTSYPHLQSFDKDWSKNLISYFLISEFIKLDHLVENRYFDRVLGYLEKKIEKIKNNYSDIIFKDFDSNKESEEEHFQKFILNDNSHITKKVKQATNYIRYLVSLNKSKLQQPSIFNLKPLKSISLTSLEFINFIKENKSQTSNSMHNSINVLDIINYLPPSIFNIDFELSLKENKRILLSQLSSGEQQMIFNINTILYHLYNLQSSFLSGNSRLVYKNINIILDEVELYYHPEMQRNILKNILDSLELVKEVEGLGIESINICFLTHSPFILSDIPSQSILKLVEGKIEEKSKVNSFAANIYDLLKEEFFLKDGAIGAYASQKVTGILAKSNIEQEDMDIINLIGDPFLKGLIRRKLEDKFSANLLEQEIIRLQEIQQKRS